ncbi:Hypothetical predicted protein [Paramuricea clavata]|uniref:Uncharacterized protein n=1 Tax=Paramuricea clavata TaxID=317549 RepID=A0A6S7IGA9_PARCT|nr:Hypothetical predicted protein [Paramuricea clavata]
MENCCSNAYGTSWNYDFSICHGNLHDSGEGEGKISEYLYLRTSKHGETFILSLLKAIYNAFCNPATGSFAWIGVDEAEIIFLNNFSWDPKIISWADFLPALEGDIVQYLPAPKNVCPRDIELKADLPFFITADAPIVQGTELIRT